MTEVLRHMVDVRAVDSAVAAVFGRYSEQWQPVDPLAKLIERVLGQRTTNAHVRRALANLEAHCGSWVDVAHLPYDVLADLIRPVGLAQQKAGRVHGILEQIYLATGEYSLRCLHEMDNLTATRFLCSLSGVGAHTAALVLVFALGRQGVMRVESHIHRVAQRLGWVGPEASLLKVEQVIERMGAAQNLMDLHVNLIRLGHEVCRPGTPDCPNCPLSDLCQHARLQAWW